MIQEVSGDILLTKAQTIAHGIAPNDHFSSGLALTLREQWPAMYQDFRHYCHASHPKPGSAWVWGGTEGKRLVNLFRQEAPPNHHALPGKASVHNVNQALKELRTLLGSTAEAVSRTAPCPVLITHPHEHDWVNAATGEIRLKNILMAYDFSNDSEVALTLSLFFAEEYQAALHLLHVIPTSSETAQCTNDELEKIALDLQEAIPEEAQVWCKVNTAVREGVPYREILEYANEHEIDLICLGVSGTGGELQMLLGTHVEPVLRQASCPVLIARPLKAASFVLAESKTPTEPQALFES